jgi:uncharacterized protein (TIGR00299 family) protein
MTRIACLKCFSGVSGDMILGALLDLGLDPAVLESGLRCLPLPGLKIKSVTVARGGIRARKFTPSFAGREPVFRTLGSVKEALRASSLDPSLIKESEKVFQRLAEAEGEAHGRTAGTVHFHELGAADTLVDVVGTLIGWRELEITEAYASAVNLGAGEVRTAHGVFPVPAPATARLMEGWPVFSDGEEGEKTTPTGAALVAHLCRPLDSLPPLRLEKAGYGAGEAEYSARPNYLQMLLGQREPAAEKEEVLVIETNLDDLNPQVYGYLTGLLLKAGALEAYVTPVVMKKGRPGHLLTLVVPPGKEEALGAILFRETGTLGYRFHRVGRVKLRREVREVQTKFGLVRVKVASFGGEGIRYAPEYEDCRRLAEKTGRALREIIEEAVRAGR